MSKLLQNAKIEKSSKTKKINQKPIKRVQEILDSKGIKNDIPNQSSPDKPPKTPEKQILRGLKCPGAPKKIYKYDFNAKRSLPNSGSLNEFKDPKCYVCTKDAPIGIYCGEYRCDEYPYGKFRSLSNGERGSIIRACPPRGNQDFLSTCICGKLLLGAYQECGGIGCDEEEFDFDQIVKEPIIIKDQTMVSFSDDSDDEYEEMIESYDCKVCGQETNMTKKLCCLY